MAFRLNDNRIALVADPVEEVSKSGLVLTESAQSPIRYGTISHVGSGPYNETGQRTSLSDFAAGDRVFFPRHAGQAIEIDQVEYLFLAPHEIIGTVE